MCLSGGVRILYPGVSCVVTPELEHGRRLSSIRQAGHCFPDRRFRRGALFAQQVSSRTESWQRPRCVVEYWCNSRGIAALLATAWLISCVSAGLAKRLERSASGKQHPNEGGQVLFLEGCSKVGICLQSSRRLSREWHSSDFLGGVGRLVWFFGACLTKEATSTPELLVACATQACL